jgi:hypothetical protein
MLAAMPAWPCQWSLRLAVPSAAVACTCTASDDRGRSGRAVCTPLQALSSSFLQPQSAHDTLAPSVVAGIALVRKCTLSACMLRGAGAEADPDGYDSEGGSPGADRAASEPLPVRAAANSHSMQDHLACCWRGVGDDAWFAGSMGAGPGAG